jgi:hypothetical protein
MRSLQRWTGSVLVLLGISAALQAQFDPAGTQVISYFPQLADGGPPSQQWVTSLTFVNPHPIFPADAVVFFNDDDGKPLSLDFGNGPVSTFNFSVGSQGSVTFTSTGVSPTTITGWATVVSSVPLQGVVQFRTSANGVPQQGVSAQSTPASGLFRSPATATTGVAIANTYSDSKIRVSISVLDADGNQIYTKAVSLPGFGHQSFTLNTMFPSLPATFRGSVLISADLDQTLVAWTLSSDGGVLSSYPPSGAASPVSSFEYIFKVWAKTVAAAPVLSSALNGKIVLGSPPDLSQDFATNSINAFADTAQNQVHVVMNMAELVGDSESEMAFLIGHEVAHIIQAHTGHTIFNTSDYEREADEISLALAMLAGYDPYAAAGAVGKLIMASGNPGLIDPGFDRLSSRNLVPQTSFKDRLGAIYSEVQNLCSMTQFQEYCSVYKSLVHPEFPPSAPLMAPRRNVQMLKPVQAQ